MPITFLKMDFVGETNVNPRIGRMISTDDFVDIIEPNYVIPYANSQGISFLPTDIIAASYGDGKGFFNVEMSGDDVTLDPTNEQGDVTVDLPTVPDGVPFWDNTTGQLDDTGYDTSSDGSLTTLVQGLGPTVVHNLAVFYDTNTSIEDIGVSVSNPTKAKVASVNGATTINNIPVFSDVSGTIQSSVVSFSDGTQSKVASVSGATVINNLPEFADIVGTIRDSGIAPTNGSLTKVSSVSGATVVGHAASFNDTSGTILDSGQRMPFWVQVNGTGGTPTNVVTVTGAAVGDLALFTADNVANGVAVVACKPTATNQVTIVFTADPGNFDGQVLIQKVP